MLDSGWKCLFMKDNADIYVCVINILEAALRHLGDDLEELLKDVQELRTFQSLVMNPNPPIEDFIVSKKRLAAAGHEFSSSYEQHEIQLQAQQCMMRNDCAELCRLLCKDSEPMQRLSSHGFDEESLSQLAAGVAQDSALGVLAQLSAGDVRKTPNSCPSKKVLLLLRDAATKTAESRAFTFLVPADAVRDIEVLDLLDPTHVDIKSLDATLTELESVSSPSGLVASFFKDSSVGSKLVGYAEEVRGSRKHESEWEEQCSQHEAAASALATSKFFMKDECVDFEALDHNAELRAFMDKCREVEKKLQDEGRRAGKRLRQKGQETPSPWKLRIKNAEELVWQSIRTSFRDAYFEAATHLCEDALDASEADGFNEEDGVKRVINLEAFQAALACEKTLENDLLQRPLALELKLRQEMLQLVQGGVKLWHVVRGSLCVALPRVAALYGRGFKEHELLEQGDLSLESLTSLGVSTKLAEPLLAFVSSQIAATKQKCNEETQSQIFNIFDMSFSESPMGLSDVQVNSFINEMPATLSSNCRAFLSQYAALASSLVDPKSNAQELANIASQIKSVSRAVEDFKAADGMEAVKVFFGTPERLALVESLLVTKGLAFERKTKDACEMVFKDVEKVASRLLKQSRESADHRGAENGGAHVRVGEGPGQAEERVKPIVDEGEEGLRVCGAAVASGRRTF